jgi:hypothetical protein
MCVYMYRGLGVVPSRCIKNSVMRCSLRSFDYVACENLQISQLSNTLSSKSNCGFTSVQKLRNSLNLKGDTHFMRSVTSTLTLCIYSRRVGTTAMRFFHISYLPFSHSFPRFSMFLLYSFVYLFLQYLSHHVNANDREC